MELAVQGYIARCQCGEGIVEFVEQLSLRFRLFDDNTQMRLQGDDVAAELTISSKMGKEHFRIGCCQ